MRLIILKEAERLSILLIDQTSLFIFDSSISQRINTDYHTR